jgi:hypothetical protein
MANAAYALGCLGAPAARPALLGPYAAVAVKCAVAAVRRHRADATVVSNGLFAVGRLCEAAEPVRALVRLARLGHPTAPPPRAFSFSEKAGRQLSATAFSEKAWLSAAAFSEKAAVSGKMEW